MFQLVSKSRHVGVHPLVPIPMITSMVSPYKSLQIWVKTFSTYLTLKEIAVTSVLARVFAYLGSFPRFWTLPVKRIFILIYSGTPPYEHPVNATTSLITATLFWPEKSLVRQFLI